MFRCLIRCAGKKYSLPRTGEGDAKRLFGEGDARRVIEQYLNGFESQIDRILFMIWSCTGPGLQEFAGQLDPILHLYLANFHTELRRYRQQFPSDPPPHRRLGRYNKAQIKLFGAFITLRDDISGLIELRRDNSLATMLKCTLWKQVVEQIRIIIEYPQMKGLKSPAMLRRAQSILCGRSPLGVTFALFVVKGEIETIQRNRMHLLVFVCLK